MTPPPDPADPGPGDPDAGTQPVTATQTRPRRLRAFLVGLVLAGVLAVLLFVVLGTTSTTGSGTGGVVPVGSTAPNFRLRSVTTGLPVVLDDLGVHRHRPVVLNFFASWCVPCQKETPLFGATASAEQAKGSVIQFVGVDAQDPPSSAIPFINQAGVTYPVGQDADLRVTANVYGLNAEPNTFFIDESGTVVGHIIGPVSRVQLDAWVHRLTGGG